MKSILVVEDDALSLEILSDFLSHHGYRVCAATTGPEAIEAFERERPDLMLVDVQIPHKNGFEVCLEVKQMARGASTPILLMSAVYTQTDHLERYEGRGLKADGYATKPFQLGALLEQVRSLLGEHG